MEAMRPLTGQSYNILTRVYGMNEWGTDHLSHPNLDLLEGDILGQHGKAHLTYRVSPDKQNFVNRKDPTPSGIHNMRIRTAS